LSTTTQTLPGSSNGDFGTDFPGYSWTATVTARDIGLTEIDVRVTWQSRSEDHNVDLATMIYKQTQ
jgi:hypothetical protein